MAVVDAVFPPEISAGALGGDTFSTDVVILKRSGKRVRNAGRQNALGVWTVAHITKDEVKFRELVSFYLAVKGMWLAFLWKDFQDYTGWGQQNCSPATGNGSNTIFQLQKTYTVPSPLTSYVRTVKKPKNGTVKIYKAGVLQTETTHYTVNYSTGVVTFVTAPANGNTIKAEYEYYKITIFGSDRRESTVEQEAGDMGIFNWDNIQIEEVDE